MGTSNASTIHWQSTRTDSNRRQGRTWRVRVNPVGHGNDGERREKGEPRGGQPDHTYVLTICMIPMVRSYGRAHVGREKTAIHVSHGRMRRIGTPSGGIRLVRALGYSAIAIVRVSWIHFFRVGWLWFGTRGLRARSNHDESFYCTKEIAFARIPRAPCLLE